MMWRKQLSHDLFPRPCCFCLRISACPLAKDLCHLPEAILQTLAISGFSNSCPLVRFWFFCLPCLYVAPRLFFCRVYFVYHVTTARICPLVDQLMQDNQIYWIRSSFEVNCDTQSSVYRTSFFREQFLNRCRRLPNTYRPLALSDSLLAFGGNGETRIGFAPSSLPVLTLR